MNSRRSPVQSLWTPLMSAKAMREPKVKFEGLRAKIAPVAASVSVSINASDAALDGPSAHSTKAVTLR